MNDRSAAVPSVTVRHEPVQARAAHRIEALLDAAAAVVVEHGIEHLTTALVAERAGASIGTVYRYFPDRVAVLVALAERNLERLRLAIGGLDALVTYAFMHDADGDPRYLAMGLEVAREQLAPVFPAATAA